MSGENVTQGQQRERFLDPDGNEVEVKWPEARKEPEVERSEPWAHVEDRDIGVVEDDEIGYEGER